MLEATFFPTLNYPDNNMLIFFLGFKMCGLLQLYSMCTGLFQARGEKNPVNKTHAMAKGAYSPSPTAWRTVYFYLGWMSQITTMRKGCVSSHSLQDLTGSQQPPRNKFEVQSAARTTWYVVGARLLCVCMLYAPHWDADP